MKYRIIMERDEDNFYIVECPNFLGCISEGKTKEEALANIKDAIQRYIVSLKKHGEHILFLL
tara:strand:+ start:16569 stop:16754 length:186 start_codon:yes stop_codon:yes gene_type:complete